MVLSDLPDGRITLIGDAADPMVPCKLQLHPRKNLTYASLVRGEGSCQAIQDSLELAHLLNRATSPDMKSVLQGYKEAMLPRGAKAVQRSRAAFGLGGEWDENVAFAGLVPCVKTSFLGVSRNSSFSHSSHNNLGQGHAVMHCKKLTFLCLPTCSEKQSRGLKVISAH